MEIFQSIWQNLTTPNEILVQIMVYILSIVEIWIGMLLFTTILKIDYTKKDKWSYIISYFILNLLTRLLIPEPYNLIVSIFIMLCLIRFIFRTNTLKTIIAMIIPYALMVFFESIFVKIFMVALNIDIYTFANIPIYRISFVLIIYVFLFLVYLLSKYLNFSIGILNNTSKKSKIILIINFSVGIAFLASQTILTGYYSENLPFPYTIISLFSLFAYFVISTYSLTKTTQLQKATEDLQELQLYNKTLTILHDNIRAFKHDFNNIVQAIGGYLMTDDMYGLKNYYQDLLEDCQKTNNLTTLSPEVINNPPIFSLLASKYHLADEKGITITLEVFVDLNSIRMKTYEFTRTLGILLDNSIEASQECEERLINVTIRKDFTGTRQLVIIENTYMQTDIDTEKIYEKSYTTKPGNTGLGLWEVRQILKKNTNLNLHTEKDDKFFRQQLEIY